MDYMSRAVELAREALGRSSPNPPVGAVIVKDGRIVGEGSTMPRGQDHAEIVALKQAGDEARGATLYATLEPCCHFGRTPPCTGAIVQAGIAEVRAALIDPNPLVNGAGIAALREAGVRAIVEECDEAAEVAEAYVRYVTTGLPFVIAKFAMSVDGKIASASGDSKWITSEEARCHARVLRGQVDAVVVGIETALSDDPRLTARDMDGNTLEKQPLRVIIDSSARLPTDSQLFREPGQVLVAAAGASEERTAGLCAAGAQVVSAPSGNGSVDLQTLLKVLGEREITSVMVEGGGRLVGSLFDLGLVDKVIAYIAPVVLGGRDSPTPVAGAGAASMEEALRLKRTRIDVIGQDVVMTGYVR